MIADALKNANPQATNTSPPKLASPNTSDRLTDIAAGVSNLQYKTKEEYQAEIITEMDEANQRLGTILSNHFNLGYVLFTVTNDKRLSRQVIPFKNAFSKELVFDWESSYSMTLTEDSVNMVLPSVTITAGSSADMTFAGDQIFIRRAPGAHTDVMGFGTKALELVVVGTNYNRTTTIAAGMVPTAIPKRFIKNVHI